MKRSQNDRHTQTSYFGTFLSTRSLTRNDRDIENFGRLRNDSDIVKTRNLYKEAISKVRIGKILSLEILVTNSMAYGTRRFNATFTRAL